MRNETEEVPIGFTVSASPKPTSLVTFLFGDKKVTLPPQGLGTNDTHNLRLCTIHRPQKRGTPIGVPLRFYYAISAALRFLPFLTITMVVTTVVVTTALAMISHTKSQLMDSLF